MPWRIMTWKNDKRRQMWVSQEEPYAKLRRSWTYNKTHQAIPHQQELQAKGTDIMMPTSDEKTQ